MKLTRQLHLKQETSSLFLRSNPSDDLMMIFSFFIHSLELPLKISDLFLLKVKIRFFPCSIFFSVLLHIEEFLLLFQKLFLILECLLLVHFFSCFLLALYCFYLIIEHDQDVILQLFLMSIYLSQLLCK